MSRGRRQAIPPPPSQRSRGIPRAGQNPDPSWFGQRARGEAHAQPHHDPVLEHFIENRAAELSRAIDESVYADMGRRLTRLTVTAREEPTWEVREWRVEPTAFLDNAFRVEARQGDGWACTFSGQDKRVSGSLSFLLRDLSLDEVADALAETLERLRRKKATTSYLHPGSRKLNLE